MHGWVKQKNDDCMPAWLKEALPEECDCGGDMENFYNPNGSMTARRCSNVKCPHLLAKRVVGLCKTLDIKGVGEATALKTIRDYGCASHFEAFTKLFPNTKIKMRLPEYLKVCFIKGVSTMWEGEAEGYEDLNEFLVGYDGKFRKYLDDGMEDIKAGARYVEFIKTWKPEFDAVVTGTVMISGVIRGFENRNDFIKALNNAMHGFVRIGVAPRVRKTGIMALIQEADTPNRGKAKCALENDIPIMTPYEFTKYVADLVQERAQL